MSSILDRARPETVIPEVTGRVPVSAPALLALLVVAMRLPWVAAAPGADEAGFLMVARQWGPGSSLYGAYWVDRPPLLITLYRLAAELGGVVPLRLLGAGAAALVVLGTARVAGQVVDRDSTGSAPSARGRTAATGAALVAAALCISPATGVVEVNGELLAAPFVVWGMSAVLAALEVGAAPRARASRAMMAGAAFAAAVLIKQNLVDVGVFAATMLLVSLLRRDIFLMGAMRLGVSFAAGAVACVVAVAGWTVLHGSSLGGVWEAMYPFRLAARSAMDASGNTAPATRLWHLVALLLLSGIPLLAAISVWGIASGRMRGSSVWALVSMLGFACASIYLGGNYWSHYLVQLIVPISVLGGLTVVSYTRGARTLLGLLAASGVIAWAVAGPSSTSPGSEVGHAVAAVAHPHDGIVTVYGHADVSETSGLTSPYPYLWSLPLKVRDPRGALLARTLSGPRAPTWFVTYAHVRSIGLDSTSTAQAVSAHYHRVADLDGHNVYLHDGLDRATPDIAH